MRIEEDPKLDFDDVLIRPKRSELASRKGVDLVREYNFLHAIEQPYKGIPIIAANMDTIGTVEMAEALSEHGLATALHKHYTLDELYDWFHSEYHVSKTVFYSMGILDNDLEKLQDFGQAPPYICVDVANGYSARFEETVSRIRDMCPDSVIMAGNVVTGEMTHQLLRSGADIVKVGIGPGSVCTTRKKTGVGYPQLSAIIECADAAHGMNGHICADGGCKDEGDVAKAFGAGADFVMLGGMLAGHDECQGSIQKRGEDDYYMTFYGMSSEIAMNQYSGGVADYRASEGKVVEVPYRGPVKKTVKQILGGLRSACTYTGARELKHLSKCTTFVKVGRQLNTVYGD